jgi:hypothetical protein
VDDRQRKIGRNEALFREVNDRIQRVSESLNLTAETMSILCECGNDSCGESIEVSVPEYERVRAEPELFFVRPGHALTDVEHVVEHRDDYDVVRKKDGPPAELARELDPRDQ